MFILTFDHKPKSHKKNVKTRKGYQETRLRGHNLVVILYKYINSYFDFIKLIGKCFIFRRVYRFANLTTVLKKVASHVIS